MLLAVRMMPRALPALIVAMTAALTACGRDAANRAGGPLLPGGSVRTVEIILDPARYLVRDTAFAGYSSELDVSYLIIAEDYQDVVDAHALARFAIPVAITAPDSAGTTRTDTMPNFHSATIALYVDSTKVNPTVPVQLELYRIAEEWDPGSATWDLRVDTTDTQIAWSEPGGTRGDLIAMSTWDPAQGDTAYFPVDSATIEAWRDTADYSRGALVRLADSDRRIRAGEIQLRLEARPSFRPDTVVTTTVLPGRPRFVFDPPTGTVAGAPRIGGITAWRTFLRLKGRLDTLAIPCPSGPAGCTLTLRETTVNYAALLLDPIAPPAGFAVEDSLSISVRLAIESNDIALSRSPLSSSVGATPTPVPPTQLVGPADAVEVLITPYIQAAAADTTSDPTLPPSLALVPGVQAGTFGFAAFQALPRLRLVLSVASELQQR